MEATSVSAQLFLNMLLGGAGSLKNNADIVNDLNVFPVPDGDTGFNMMKTLEGGIAAAAKGENETVGSVAENFAKGALLSARGNSGVILSQIIKGIQKGLYGLKSATASDFAKAYKLGIEYSYAAVENPVEGTILTVFREATEYASQNINENSTVEEFLRLHILKAHETLIKTKEMLPVLKEADVVDSGGAGYVYIAEGMFKALSGEEIAVTLDGEAEKVQETDLSLFTRDSEMVYGYCTEFILRLQTKKCDPDNFDISVITDYLKSAGGDSIVAYKADDAVKVHVHTLTPGKVLSYCQKYGEFLTLKIENMSLQHTETEAAKKKPLKKLAVAAVCNGEGIKDIFRQLGADAIIDGGQTQNPSAGDFIKAFENLSAEKIIVLPNNSNVFLAAKQAQEMFGKSKVYVAHTKTMQEGYVALSVINTAVDDIDVQMSDIAAAVSGVESIEVTYAIRTATINGMTVEKGEFMAISGGEMKAVGKNAVETALKAIEKIADDKEIVTAFYGEDFTEEETEKFRELFEENYPDLELCEYYGGQKVYSVLLSVE